MTDEDNTTLQIEKLFKDYAYAILNESTTDEQILKMGKELRQTLKSTDEKELKQFDSVDTLKVWAKAMQKVTLEIKE